MRLLIELSLTTPMSSLEASNMKLIDWLVMLEDDGDGGSDDGDNDSGNNDDDEDDDW